MDGGKIEYMVEAILETTRFMGQKKKTAVYLPVPLIAKVNIAELHLREPKQTTTEWPKIEDEINKCRLHANIRRSGWMRGKKKKKKKEKSVISLFHVAFNQFIFFSLEKKKNKNR